MITIKRVTIENFQSHEKTTLDFVKGLNVIVGPSDQGKSAILRAIKWALYNEPRGTDFIRQGTTTARVSILMDNDFEIVRERSKAKNRYIVNAPDGGQSIFEGFGNEVPEEVIKAHGIPKVILDTDISSILNISDQLEGPFLLSETPSVRAKAIGRLTGLHIIDKAIRDCIVDFRRENQTSDRFQDELKAVYTKLEQYKELELIKQKIDSSEYMINRLGDLIDIKNTMEEQNRKLQQYYSEYSDLELTTKKLAGLVECERHLKNCETFVSRLDLLKHCRDIYAGINVEMEKASRLYSKTEFLNECSYLISEAIGLKPRLEKLTESKKVFISLKSETDKQKAVLERTEQIHEVEQFVRSLSVKLQKTIILSEAFQKLTDLNNEIAQTRRQLVKSDKILAAGEILEQIREKSEILSKLEEFKSQNGLILNYISEGKKFFEKNKREIELLTKQFAQTLRKIGKCPLCSSDISEVKIVEIVKHYEEGHL